MGDERRGEKEKRNAPEEWRVEFYHPPADPDPTDSPCGMVNDVQRSKETMQCSRQAAEGLAERLFVPSCKKCGQPYLSRIVAKK